MTSTYFAMSDRFVPIKAHFSLGERLVYWAHRRRLAIVSAIVGVVAAVPAVLLVSGCLS